MAAFQTPVFFGYRVDSNLSDVINKNLALSNINLDINDLEVIRGVSSEEGATRFDFQAISRLEEDVYRTLDRFQSDTGQYNGILQESPGADIALRGNLNVNGGVGGSAIRYRKVNDANDGIEFLDISTSLLSAWSTTTNPVSPTDPIYYGGEVRVVSGGNMDTDDSGGRAQPDLSPLSFVEQERLDSASIDNQNNQRLRPLRIKDSFYVGAMETKEVELDRIYGFDREVVTSDIFNTEATFIVGETVDEPSGEIQVTLNTAEQ